MNKLTSGIWIVVIGTALGVGLRHAGPRPATSSAIEVTDASAAISTQTSIARPQISNPGDAEGDMRNVSDQPEVVPDQSVLKTEELQVVDEVVKAEQQSWDETEDETQRCMQSHGFTYVPRTFTGGTRQHLGASPLELKQHEATQQGFGLIDATLLAPGEAVDPNNAMLETLSTENQEAWQAALTGEDNPSTGCRQTAHTLSSPSKQRLAVVDRQIRTRGKAIESDPRYRSLWKRWSQCMHKAGIDAPDLESLQKRIASAAATLARPTKRAPQAEDGEVSQPLQPMAELEATQPQDADEIRAFEVRAAEAAVACQPVIESRLTSVLADYSF